ncbi:MAG: 30S ribosomal protein S6, partial [Alphaproteobacteria bacterium]|nr:30S ribosomal protein S6 [Alphaproteobacteria bacterium]
QGGSVKGHEYWGLKTMAYRIKKNRKGHYVMMNIDAESAAVAEMERNQQLNEDVLRHLTLRVETFEEGPSVMMQGKRDGDRRGPRFDRRDDRDGRDRAGKNDDADRSAAKTVAVETKQKEGETPVEDDPKEQKPAAEDATKEEQS